MVKVIVTGDVARLDLLHNKLSTLNASAVGPFDAVFVTNLLDVAALVEYSTSNRAFPLPLYFLTADEAAVPKEFFAGSNDLRIRCLSGAGHEDIAGLKVAHAHVRHHAADAASAASTGFAELLETCKRLGKDRPHGRDTVFDLLLTNLPPTGGFSDAGASAPHAVRSLPDSLVSSQAADLAAAAEPRYHFCPAGAYFQRAPYKNGSSGMCTRLISVAPFDGVSDGKGENKNLHALNLTPSPSVDIKTLLDVPEGSTASPYAKPSAAGSSSNNVRPAGAASSAAARAALGVLNRSGPNKSDSTIDGAEQGASLPPAAKRPRHDEDGPGAAGSSSGGAGLSAEQVAMIEAEAARGNNGNQFFWNVRGGRGGGRGGYGGRGGMPMMGGMGGMGMMMGPGGGSLLGAAPPMGMMGMMPGNQFNQQHPHQHQRGGPRGAAPHYTQKQYQQQLGNQGRAAECWFCLASPQVEKHLIVAIGEEAYLALPKGPVSEASHALIIPITHHVSLATAPQSLQREVRRFINAVAKMYAAQGLKPVLFERVLQARRGETPVHTHIQMLGLPASSVAPMAESTFMTEGAFKQVPFAKLPAPAVDGETEEQVIAGGGPYGRFDALLPHVAASASDVTAVQTGNSNGGNNAASSGGSGTSSDDASSQAVAEYLYVEVPSSSSAASSSVSDGGSEEVCRLLHKVPPGVKHPVQFGREVMCRLLNCPDKLSWKTCAVGLEGETAATAAFRKAFAPFDFTVEPEQEPEAGAEGNAGAGAGESGAPAEGATN